VRILVIEDNEALNRNMVRYLSLKDIHSEASFDGKDGLYKASTKYYDAIILDINLPEIDGIELCKQLREK
jgi:DNA-binding response OmpR family regulator